MKNKILSLSLLSLFLISCQKTNSSSTPETIEPELKVSFEAVNNQKKLVLSNGYETSEGALGVRVAYDEIDDVSEILYAHYSNVSESNGVFVATAEVTTTNGSKIKAIDTINNSNNKFELKRIISVEEVGSEIGFTTYFPLLLKTEKQAEDFKWFAPSDYYGNDDYTFSGVGVKTGFDGGESIIPADNAGAPLLLSYADKVSFALLDKTLGQRETVAGDLGVKENQIVVDERINIPGLGIKNVSNNNGNYVEMYHMYPASTYNYISAYPFYTLFRMLPLTLGLSRTVVIEGFRQINDSFYEASETSWRYAYDTYAVIDKRYLPNDIKQTLLENVNNSYAVVNSTSQYMTNTDHFEAESGFLYRNVDLGWLLLVEGRRTNNTSYINNALAVIDAQISRDRIDRPIYKHERSSVDGLLSLLQAYKAELKMGYSHPDWLNYLMTSTNNRLNGTNWLSMALFTEMAKLTESTEYLNKAISLAESIKDKQSNFIFEGAIMNPAGDRIIDRESGIIAFRAYLDLYDLTNDNKWLEMAKISAFFVESNHQLQAIDLAPLNSVGLEYDRMKGNWASQGYIGNSKIMPYGLSYISGQTTNADISGMLSAPDFYRLYQITNDRHYYDFCEYLQYNCTLYVNMGDKVGLMDDMIHSSGLGFINEYIGIAAGGDSVAPSRGTVHDSNIAWVPFAILQTYERLLEMTNEISIGEEGDFNLLKHKNVSKVIDGYVVDLGEYCNISTVLGTDASYSKDNITFSSNKEAVRYVKVLKEDVNITINGLEGIEIIGLPLLYNVLSYNAVVSSNGGENPHSAVDFHNYNTSYTTASNKYIQLDFGTTKDIYQVALKLSTNANNVANGNTSIANFVIETSNDEVSWNEYQTYNDRRYVYSNYAYVSARYVRVTFISSAGYLKDLKVLGL